MSQFNNSEYQVLASDIIGDTFYADTSYRGKVAKLRQYAELIIRKILDIFPEQQITLGNTEIKKQIVMLPDRGVIENAVKKLQKKGNDTTHTQFRGEVSSADFEDAVDGVFDLLSYLLIRYFTNHEFGANPNIMFSFSILPPIIRYKVLIFLYQKYPNNIFVIDKLVLATLKAFDVGTAMQWVEEKKDVLLQLTSAKTLSIIEPPNMYELCKEKITLLESNLSKSGLLYSDFESALPYYKQLGIIQNSALEVCEFNDIMEFLYMGRKERDRLCDQVKNSIILLNTVEPMG